MRSLLYIVSLLIICSVIGCVRTPEGVIEPDKMEDLLVDIHISEGLMETEYAKYASPAQKEEVMQSVLRKHHVTGAEFDSSLSWYGRNLDQYVKIYNKVIERIRLKDEAVKELIAKEKMQTLTLPGDTVDIWKQERSFLISPEFSNNLLSFRIPVDENFKQNDRFVLEMRFRMMPNDLKIHPRLTLAIQNSNNSINKISKDVFQNGWVSLELKSDTSMYFKNVFGNLYLPPRQLIDNQRIYVDSIRLTRYHANPGVRP